MPTDWILYLLVPWILVVVAGMVLRRMTTRAGRAEDPKRPLAPGEIRAFGNAALQVLPHEPGRRREVTFRCRIGGRAFHVGLAPDEARRTATRVEMACRDERPPDAGEAFLRDPGPGKALALQARAYRFLLRHTGRGDRSLEREFGASLAYRAGRNTPVEVMRFEADGRPPFVGLQFDLSSSDTKDVRGMALSLADAGILAGTIRQRAADIDAAARGSQPAAGP